MLLNSYMEVVFWNAVWCINRISALNTSSSWSKGRGQHSQLNTCDKKLQEIFRHVRESFVSDSQTWPVAGKNVRSMRSKAAEWTNSWYAKFTTPHCPRMQFLFRSTDYANAHSDQLLVVCSVLSVFVEMSCSTIECTVGLILFIRVCVIYPAGPRWSQSYLKGFPAGPCDVIYVCRSHKYPNFATQKCPLEAKCHCPSLL